MGTLVLDYRIAVAASEDETVTAPFGRLTLSFQTDDICVSPFDTGTSSPVPAVARVAASLRPTASDWQSTHTHFPSPSTLAVGVLMQPPATVKPLGAFLVGATAHTATSLDVVLLEGGIPTAVGTHALLQFSAVNGSKVANMQHPLAWDIPVPQGDNHASWSQLGVDTHALARVLSVPVGAPLNLSLTLTLILQYEEQT